MRSCLAGLVAVLVVLVPTAAVWADIPPPPPPGLKDSPGPRPVVVSVAGTATALAIAAAGVMMARSRPSVRSAALAIAVALLVATAVGAWWSSRAWNTHAALEEKYRQQLANWRPRGPVRPPPGRREAPLAVSLLAWSPQQSFPSALPWAALALSHAEGP